MTAGVLFRVSTGESFPPLQRRSHAVSAFWTSTITNVVRRNPISPIAVSLPSIPSIAVSLPSKHGSNPVIFTSARPTESPIKPIIFKPSPSVNGPAPHFLSRGVSKSFDGPLKFFACPVSSPEGAQCPRGSFVHAPFCRFHLREHLNLDVKTSSVPGAGRGLFSLTSRRPGDHLVDYFGEVLDAKAIEGRYPAKDTGVYTLGLSNSLFIDSALVRGVGASVNAPPLKGSAQRPVCCEPSLTVRPPGGVSPY